MAPVRTYSFKLCPSVEYPSTASFHMRWLIYSPVLFSLCCSSSSFPERINVRIGMINVVNGQRLRETHIIPRLRVGSDGAF